MILGHLIFWGPRIKWTFLHNYNVWYIYIYTHFNKCTLCRNCLGDEYHLNHKPKLCCFSKIMWLLYIFYNFLRESAKLGSSTSLWPFVHASQHPLVSCRNFPPSAPNFKYNASSKFTISWVHIKLFKVHEYLHYQCILTCRS